MKSVSESFHEKALRLRSGFPSNSTALAEDSPKGVTTSLFEHDVQISRLERNASSEATIKTNNKSPLEPPIAGSGNTGDSTKPTMLHTQEKIYPRLQREFQQASEPAIPEPGSYSASLADVKYAALFESVVYPAMKKSKKRHIDSILPEDLDAIGKIVSPNSIQQLKTS